MPPKVTPFSQLPDVLLFEPQVHEDARGWLMETYRRSDWEAVGVPHAFVQDVQSRSVGRGVVRGLHYQLDPHSQGKLVRCIVGECLDVAVDLRRSSPTFGRHVTTRLSAQNKHSIWIPPGFAHGFCTLSDACEILYKFTHSEFSAPHARIVRWNDPAIGIRWPVDEPVLNEKDARAPLLADAEVYRE